jgi:hypothetical protein
MTAARALATLVSVVAAVVALATGLPAEADDRAARSGRRCG